MDDRTYVKNCIISFIIGLVLLGPGLFNHQFQEGHHGVLFFGGYMGMSIYVGWRIIRSIVLDLFKTGSILGCLVFPILIPITLVASLLIGMIVCIPMFIFKLIKILR